ncbi:hypothetical protein TNCV_2518261 [Trichonephila clavipes]|nr:hypothetical protein TNCV_2518261 [Trichonephila clavipes]
MNALDVRRLLAPLKTCKRFLKVVRMNRLQTIAEIAESVKATCPRILKKNLNKYRVSQHIVLRMLNEDKKVIRMEMAVD